MLNKSIILPLTISVLLVGVVAVYSLHTNNELGQRVMFMTGDISNLSDQIENNITDLAIASNTLESNLRDFNTELAVIGGEVELSLSRIVALTEEVDLNIQNYNEIKHEIEDVVFELSEDRSQIVVNKIYDSVVQSVVSISDGTNIIGSGYVYDSKGHIITANHVAAGLSNIYVIFEDGRISQASLIGSSETSDVSVILINSQLDIAPVKMADSSSIQIGEAVITIGSPFTLSGTVTSGIVSQIDRAEVIGSESDSQLISNLIQFDASVNYGNSGSPLFNIDGDVIGMIIARVGPTTGEGISYAVSANKVTKVVDVIINRGLYDYPWLGIGVNDITPEMAEERDLYSVNGVIIDLVTNGGPADQAGLRPGDIIISVDAETMRRADDLTSYIGEFTSPGDTMSIIVYRNGSIINLNATLGVQ